MCVVVRDFFYCIEQLIAFMVTVVNISWWSYVNKGVKVICKVFHSKKQLRDMHVFVVCIHLLQLCT